MPARFDGLRVVSFESRRATEIAELIRRQGGEPLAAPSMREVANAANEPALGLARRLRAGEIDVAIFLTGVGTRILAESISAELAREELGRELGRIATVARGPKPVAALRELGVAPTLVVPEPNTWKELLAALDQALPVRDRTVAVQEYGAENPELLEGLSARGARVLRVPVYRWALPEDLGPLREAIRRVVAGEVDVALFTSATQVEHLFQVAAGQSTLLAEALSRIVVASIGPVCSGALERHGVAVDLEPPHPRMGHLVRAAADRARTILGRKRSASRSDDPVRR